MNGDGNVKNFYSFRYCFHVKVISWPLPHLISLASHAENILLLRLKLTATFLKLYNQDSCQYSLKTMYTFSHLEMQPLAASIFVNEWICTRSFQVSSKEFSIKES